MENNAKMVRKSDMVHPGKRVTPFKSALSSSGVKVARDFFAATPTEGRGRKEAGDGEATTIVVVACRDGKDREREAGEGG